MIVFRDDGIDVGEVPIKIARAISGNAHTAVVTGFKALSFGVAPVLELRPPTSLSRLSLPRRQAFLCPIKSRRTPSELKARSYRRA